MRRLIKLVMVLVLALGLLGVEANAPVLQHGQQAIQAVTPIQHLVAIFDENVSFDH